MKNTNQNNGLLVENEIIEKAELGDNVKLVATDHLIVLTKAKMTAMDLVETIDSMSTLLYSLIDGLAECCGECDGCDHCEDLDFEPIHLPDEVLKIAGIPIGTKLAAFVEEDEGAVHIEPAEYDYDISDVPVHLLATFSDYGICLGELDALLMENEVL
ncbi:MAG: hypothetical protein EOM05_00290 [Clostridia bacterium]|nr:hypothetical protein [Clostridia bacterium]